MNARNIKKWVAALRSGEFQQGRNFLSQEGKFCCLGVACVLAKRDGLPVEVKYCSCSGCDGKAVVYDGDTAILPPSVRDWLGLDERDPHATYAGESYKLSRLNDDGGFNFADIADIIERSYLPGASDSWWDKESVGVAA